MAWYESDRGNAGNAVSLLGRLPEPPDHVIANLSEFVREGRTDLGRNELCWCGSGLKYKKCHLNRQEDVSLSDRVSWLCLKAVWYLEHQGSEARQEILALASALAGPERGRDSLFEALEDPLVMDLALAEGGWFEAFVAERGDLLPGDELELAESWLLVERTVYEIQEVRVGGSLVLKDLATDERLQVTQSSTSDQFGPGLMVCGRAVPDGKGYQFIGGTFPVSPGTQERVLQLCALADGFELCAWVAELRHPTGPAIPESQLPLPGWLRLF